MADLGNLICRVCDDESEVHVYQDARLRYLTLGNAVEQSCLDLANPSRLEHAYTQAMMLALLLGEPPHSALLLGLGGGSLARALRAAERGLRIVGVERRAAVIDVARTHFQLPEDRRFETVCSEAVDFLRHDARCHDLVMADLYLADRMHPDQFAADFLAACRARLSEAGVLVLNQWASEFRSNRVAFATLSEIFDGRVLTLHVQGGNIVSFALRGQLPPLRRAALFDAAQALGLRLAIPLQRHARNLWNQNAEVLGVGRFRNRVRR